VIEHRWYPRIDRMTAITLRCGGHVSRRLAAGCRSIVATATGSAYTRMIKGGGSPSRGCMTDIALLGGGNVIRRLTRRLRTVMT